MAFSIPAEPEFGPGQEAEQAVWRQLCTELPDDVAVAHSAQVRNGTAEHEIDLLVLWPNVGLAAIEVKGGRISVENGQWIQSDRKGGHPIQSPIAQSQGSAHALSSWLESQLGSKISSRFAYMACFPYTRVQSNWSMAGTPRSLVIDQHDLADDLAAYLRTAIEQEGGGASGLAPSFMERILVHLRGDLATERTVAGDASEIEDQQNSLTDRQATLLAATRSLPRVRFLGGAGSGKTYLALRKAEQLCREGKRVGLFCYNKGLGLYLRNEVDRWRGNKPVFTGEFHEYALKAGVPSGEGQDYYDADMPRLLREISANISETDKLDAVIVDEAQDFAPLWWEALLSRMRDPLGGEVYAFMDDRQDVYRRWDGEGFGGAFHEGIPLVPIHVDENLRNTRKIAEIFKPFAGEYFKPRASTGLPVRIAPTTTDNALDVASDCLDALIDEGWANNQIALLTTNRRHPIHQEHFENETIPEYWQEFHRNEAEFYGNVLGFKGLERSVVILCVDGFRDLERAAERLYVGLSRARCLLVIVGDPKLIIEAGGREMELALRRAETWQLPV
ncbi:NERD domain-containing protein [Arthrobacter sp. AOP36-C1-22]|uniref:NERD domain-containing protein n=1 Tax=Arthrobacter sp. AOP36-C1-22 TaxID=3457683 RepID=UPI00403494CD